MVKQLAERGVYLFVTDLVDNFYESFGESWAGFVGAVSEIRAEEKEAPKDEKVDVVSGEKEPVVVEVVEESSTAGTPDLPPTA